MTYQIKPLCKNATVYREAEGEPFADLPDNHQQLLEEAQQHAEKLYGPTAKDIDLEWTLTDEYGRLFRYIKDVPAYVPTQE